MPPHILTDVMSRLYTCFTHPDLPVLVCIRLGLPTLVFTHLDLPALVCICLGLSGLACICLDSSTFVCASLCLSYFHSSDAGIITDMLIPTSHLCLSSLIVSCLSKVSFLFLTKLILVHGSNWF